MKRFSERQKNILQIIASSNGTTSSKTICSHLGVSVRTVQNDIRQINRLAPVIISSNKGYQVDYKEYELLDHSFHEQEQYYSDDDLLRTLLIAEKPVQIDDLSDDFYMSTPTLEKKIRIFNQRLTSYDLRIQRLHNHLSIRGSEINKRRCLHDIFFNEITSNNCYLYDLFNDKLSNVFNSNLSIEEVMSQIFSCIEQNGYYTDDVYQTGIFISMIISIDRVCSGHHINDNTVFEITEASPEACIASDICRKLKIDTLFTSNDILYMASLLVGQIKPLALAENILDNSTSELSSDLSDSINSILADTFDHFLLNIDFADQSPIFASHIDAMIKRLKVGNIVKNEFLEAIKQNSPFIHDVATYIARSIDSLVFTSDI